ncbi:hypothetical protein C0Q70_11531 [Pomacea canaliculata]|uniref:Uncharacterized protein n=1 Tax=Pomacea canaliculata TaxID=400727 RepID=A0A2T7P6C3_POMCA|nr:hypothetical protein C0Q70_11531 [Pomacea canaliculata]
MTPSAQAAAQAEVPHQGRRQTAADQVPHTHDDNCKWAVARHDHQPRLARKDGEVVTRSDLVQVTGPQIFLCSSANYLMETEQKFNFAV